MGQQNKTNKWKRFIICGALLGGAFYAPLAWADYVDPPYIHYFDGRQINTASKLAAPSKPVQQNAAPFFSARYKEPKLIHYDHKVIVSKPQRIRYRIENANSPVISKVHQEVRVAVNTGGKPIVRDQSRHLQVLDQCQKSIQGVATSNIHFFPGSSRLKKKSLPVLEKIVAILNECKAARIVVAGHTDSDGNEHANQILSGRRAQAVNQKLVKMGIDGSRIHAVALGESQPLVENNSKENKALNRRIEFRLY